MALDNPVQSQEIHSFKSFHFVFSQFHYGASGDTVKVPRGCMGAAVFTRSGTAPTASVAAGSVATGFDTVTLTGGTENNGGCVLVSRHTANLASIG